MISRLSQDPALLIFDADNTLWDTNAVFREAQLALLRPFAAYVPNLSPEEEFRTLRHIDRLLFQRLGTFEYDFRLLATAMAHFYLQGLSVEDSICRAIEGTDVTLSPAETVLVEQAHHDYNVALKAIPSLLPDAGHVLKTLREKRSLKDGLALTLFSEGDPDRLERILTAHGLAGTNVFDATHIGPKSTESFARFQEIGQGFLNLTNGSSLQTVVIGDSLKREIKCGNHIGATTVYIPSGFMGTEQPAEEDEEPDYILSRLGELPNVLYDLR
ncbi:MAG: hypothetical protein JWN14_2197 [Chthonomonadales bacterium]|nr:hypothetical protein [Chthonomonadales bacterium]